MDLYTSRTYHGDGSTKVFAVPSYLEPEDIKVFIDTVPYTNFTWRDSSNIELADTPAVNSVIVISSQIQKDHRDVVWQPTALLNSEAMNTADNQFFLWLQELWDKACSSITLGLDGIFDALGKRIKNVGTPQMQ